MNEVSSFIQWYRRFWDEDPSLGDSEAAVRAKEKALGVGLPSLLRAVFLETTFRQGQMLHLRRLEELAIEDGVLAFAFEQQAAFGWGIREEDLDEANPPLVCDAGGAWALDGCRLLAFLRFVTVANRPYAAPTVAEVYALDSPDELRKTWTPETLESQAMNHTLWIRAEAVVDFVDEEGIAIGARTNDGLREALRALDLAVDDEALELVEEPRG